MLTLISGYFGLPFLNYETSIILFIASVLLVGYIQNIPTLTILSFSTGLSLHYSNYKFVEFALLLTVLIWITIILSTPFIKNKVEFDNSLVPVLGLICFIGFIVFFAGLNVHILISSIIVIFASVISIRQVQDLNDLNFKKTSKISIITYLFLYIINIYAGIGLLLNSL
jgi:hypothetical protein